MSAAGSARRAPAGGSPVGAAGRARTLRRAALGVGGGCPGRGGDGGWRLAAAASEGGGGVVGGGDRGGGGGECGLYGHPTGLLGVGGGAGGGGGGHVSLGAARGEGGRQGARGTGASQ